jgi:flagellar protein FliO/FliZ
MLLSETATHNEQGFFMNKFLFFILFTTPSLFAQQIPLPEELKSADTGNESRFMSEFIHMFIVLGLIIILLYVGAWMFRRMMSQRIQQMNVTSNIKVLEHRSLSPKSVLYIIEAYGKTVLISESQNGVKFLSELPEVTNESE